jgi:hypothetical protein
MNTAARSLIEATMKGAADRTWWAGPFTVKRPRAMTGGSAARTCDAASSAGSMAVAAGDLAVRVSRLAQCVGDEREGLVRSGNSAEKSQVENGRVNGEDASAINKQAQNRRSTMTAVETRRASRAPKRRTHSTMEIRG